MVRFYFASRLYDERFEPLLRKLGGVDEEGVALNPKQIISYYKGGF